MTFEDKLRRNNTEDKIELGNIVDVALRGDFGYLLRAIINGIVKEELTRSKADYTIPPERVLGRIESIDYLTEQLDLMVDIKNQLEAERKEQSEIK
jgi:hypothetical protein